MRHEFVGEPGYGLCSCGAKPAAGDFVHPWWEAHRQPPGPTFFPESADRALRGDHPEHHFEEPLDTRDQLLIDLQDRLDEMDGTDAGVIQVMEDRLSIGDWLERVRGAGMSAQQNARAGLVVPEEKDWLELAAIALRRIETIRRLA